MTDSLKAYLQGDFLREKQEVEQISKMVEEVWPLFLDFAFFDSPKVMKSKGAGWPYKISDVATPMPPDSKNFSYSTNAMILFLFGIVLDAVKPGVLVPDVSVSKIENKYKKKSQTILYNGMSQIAQRSKDEQQPKSRVVYSNSFGKNDPFTITWLLELLTSDTALLGSDGNTVIGGFKSNLLEVATNRLEQVSTKDLLEWDDNHKDKHLSADHMFPLLRYAHINRLIDRHKNNGASGNPEQDQSNVLLDRFLNRMHYHMSQAAIPNGAFDAAELAFATEGILLTKNDPQALEPDVLNRVFEIIKLRQEVSPYWRPLKPFVTTPQGFALLPLSVEIASSLLRICCFVDRDQKDESYFSENIELFRRYVTWLQARKVKIEVKNSRADSKQQYSGWHSEHVHGTEMIHPWETSQVMIFLLHYQAMLKDHIARASRTAAQLKFDIKKLERKNYEEDSIENQFKQFEPLLEYWPEKESFDGLSEMPAYANLLHRYVAPQRTDLKSIASKSPMYSALIYGPPGTGKTTFARELANALNWKLLTLTPSNFIAGGESEVESRAKDLFEMLEQQDNVVILFDEIDRLILDRESPLYLQQGDMFQFMTPSMLTKLNNLRACKKSIFLIATNYEERIDRAVKRIGRIDYKLMLPPPGKLQREEILIKAICDLYKSNHCKQLSEKELKHMKKTEEWKEVLGKTVLATYGELRQLVSRTFENPNFVAEALSVTLLEECKAQKSPEIRLSSYKRRFLDKDNDNKIIDGQCPYLEFFVLVHLVQESGREFKKEEIDFLKEFSDALKCEHKQVTDSIKEWIQDPAIAKSIEKAFEANK